MSFTVEEYFEKRPLRELLAMPDTYLDQAMAQAFQLFTARRYDDAELLCRGIIAADPKYWFAYALHAMSLVHRGQLNEALARIEKALKYEPGQDKLLAIKAEILGLQKTVDAIRERAAALRAAKSNLQASAGNGGRASGASAAKNPVAAAARAEGR